MTDRTEAETGPEKLEKVISRIERAQVGWLPIVGEVVTVTFDLAEAKELVASLRKYDLAQLEARSSPVSGLLPERRGNPEAIWKLVMAMKLNGIPKEALSLGFLADFEAQQFEEFWSLGYADLCKWGVRRD